MTAYWESNLSNYWSDPLNWSTDVTPGASTDVVIEADDNVGNCIVSDETDNAGTVNVLGGIKLIVTSGGNLQVTTSLTIGNAAGDYLEVNGGSTVAITTGSNIISIGTATHGNQFSQGYGTLVIGGTTATAWGGGSLGDAEIDLNCLNSLLDFNTTDNVTLDDSIDGVGYIVEQGAGTTVTLTGTSYFTGGTTIYSGTTIQVGNGNATAALGAGTIIDNGTLTYDLTALNAINNLISGSGPVNFMGGGEFELLTVSTYTGTTTIAAGSRLDVGIGTGLAATGTGGVVDNGTLAYDFNATQVVGNLISGAGAVLMFGGGLTLTAANTYTGATYIGAGTITVGNGGTKGTLGNGGAVTLAAASATLDFNHSDNVFVGNAISGSGVVNQIGGGALVLTSNNAYTGNTTISSGILQVGAGGAAGSLGTGAVVDNGALYFSQTGQHTVANAISGSGSLVKFGTNQLILEGANSYGTTTISAGSLDVGFDTATGTLGAGAVTDNGDLDFARSDATTVSNLISGSGAVDQFYGATTLTAANTWQGVTTVDSGTLKGGATNAISQNSSSVTVDSGATLDLDGFDETLQNLSGAGTIDNTGTAAVTLTAVNTATTNFSGTIQDRGGVLSLVKAGSGTLNLFGVNTFTGEVTVSAGTLSAQGSNLDSLGAGNVVDNATLSLGGGSTYGNVISGSGVVTTSGDGVVLTATNTYTGGTTIGASTSLQVGNGGATGTLGAISGGVADSGDLVFDRSDKSTFAYLISGSGIVTQSGSGTTILTAANTYTGSTDISSGTLTAGIANAISMSSSVEFNSGAIFDLGGFNQSVNQLLGTGTVNNSATGGATLTDNFTGSGELYATIENTGGALGFTKAGSGYLVLGGTNTYTGATTVSAGTLQAGAQTSAFGVGSNVSVASGAFLSLFGFSESIGSIGGAGTVENNSGGTAATLTFTGNYATSGNGAFTGSLQGNLNVLINASSSQLFNGSETYTGTTTINGVLAIEGSLASSSIVDNGGFDLDESGAVTFASNISGTGNVDAVTGTLTFSGANTYTGGAYIAFATMKGGVANAFGSGFVDLDESTGVLDLGGFNQSIGALSGSGTVENSGAAAVTLAETNAAASAFGGILKDGTGAIKLTKSGAGTLTLSGANTYSGGTTLSQGTLKAGAANAFGAGAVTVNSGATLDLGGFSENEAISNSGTVTNSTGAGALNGALTNNGVLSATGGSLTVNLAVTGSGSAKITAGASLIFNNAFGQAVAFSGAGSLQVAQNYQGAVTGFGASDSIAYQNTTWTSLSGSKGAVSLKSSQLSLTGGDDTVTFAGGTGDAVSLYSTGGAYDSVSGSAGTLYETSAKTNVSGGDDTIGFAGGTGNVVSLYATGSAYDSVSGSNGTIYETSAQASITGGNDSIIFAGGAGNVVSLYSTANSYDGVSGSNGTIYETSAQASIAGGGDSITFSGGSGNAASLYATGGKYDGISGSNGTIYETSAQASVTGGDDSITFSGGSGNAVSLYATANSWDGVSGSNGTIYETSAQTSVSGGGDVITFAGGTGNAASLYSTAGVADTVNGASGLIYLTNASAAVNGASNAIHFAQNDTLTASGNSEQFLFAAAMGVSTISGFNSTDTIQLSASDFANFAAMQSHTAQSGANTTITFDANDVLTLANVTATSLTSSEFKYV